MGTTTTTTEDTSKAPTAEEYAQLATEYQGSQRVKAKTTKRASHSSSADIQAQVNTLMTQVTIDAEGKVVYPDDTPVHLKLLVAGEKKFRDTQRSYTKQQQSTKELEAENRLLKEKLSEAAKLDIPKEEAERLEELKFSNPDKWFEEMTALQSTPMTKYDDIMSEVKTKAGAEFELDRRIEVLKEFNTGRELPITPEVLDNDVPPRITKSLAEGKLSFEEYLSEVDSYLSKGKAVANPKAPSDTNLQNVSGTTDSRDAGNAQLQTENMALDYVNITL